ncbi:hypothetical protein AURDEDRAFT_159089 [Auricularia subglabra TFB-10046 SS5]|nr:hypothetical protein AURDEDRAFT_159089 [Auricularia subglabra TFB-10046 SS5]
MLAPSCKAQIATAESSSHRADELTRGFAPHFAPELLLLYFERLATHQLVNASHVCQKWREHVYTRSNFTRVIRLSSATDATLARFSAQMSTSRTCGLSVTLDLPVCDTPLMHRALHILGRELGRVRILSPIIHVSHANILWETLYSAAPMLEEFYMHFENPSAGPAFTMPVVPADIFCGHAPLLRRLGLLGVALPLRAPSGISNAAAVTLVARDEIRVDLASCLASFPQLVSLCFVTVGQDRVVLPEDSSVVSASTSLGHPQAVDELYLHLGHGVEQVLQRTCAFTLFRSVVVSLPSPEAVMICPQSLPQHSALHLALLPTPYDDSFFVGIRCLGTGRSILFEETRRTYDSDCDRLRDVYLRGHWMERVSKVTVSATIWSHPHLAQWIPRLPNVTRVGVVLDGPSNQPPPLSPAIRFDFPTLAVVELAALHVSLCLGLQSVKSMVATGFKVSPKVLGICDGVSIGLDGAGFASQPIIRPRLFNSLLDIRTW